jgi:hypothetical protein
VSIPVTGGFDISRALNRGATIWLASGSGRAPIIAEGANAANESTATIWRFPVVNERPKGERVRLNYHTLLNPIFDSCDELGLSGDRWTIDGMTAAEIGNLQIALADGKNAAKSGWGKIPTGTYDDGAGINVQPLNAQGKVVSTQYLIRIAPTATGGLTPGSNPARVRAAGNGRATSFRIDFRNDVIRGRAGTQWRTDSIEATSDDGLANGIFTRENARDGLPLVYEARYVFRNVPTAEKPNRPATQWQVIDTPEQTVLTMATVANLSVSNGRLTLPKGTVIFNTERERWGGAPRAPAAAGNVTVRVRQNATMRHNPRSATAPFGPATAVTSTNEVLAVLTYTNTAPPTASKERIQLTGISVAPTATTWMAENEIVFVPAAAATPVINIEENEVPANAELAVFTVFFGADPTGTPALDPASYTLSGLPAPLLVADVTNAATAVTTPKNVEMIFSVAAPNLVSGRTINWQATATIKTTDDVTLTANVSVAARVAVATIPASGSTPAGPAIPGAALWSATISRTLAFTAPPTTPAATSIGTITGLNGSAVTGTITITLTNETFHANVTNGLDVRGWFTALPANVTATATRTDDRNVSIAIAGTAGGTVTNSTIAIPNANLVTTSTGTLAAPGASVTVATGATATATTNATNVEWTTNTAATGDATNMSGKTITITLSGDATFVTVSELTALSATTFQFAGGAALFGADNIILNARYTASGNTAIITLGSGGGNANPASVTINIAAEAMTGAGARATTATVNRPAA